MRGTFVGPADKLAASDQEYPLLRWEARVSDFRRKEDDTHEVSFAETLTAMCGKEVHFRPESSEIWGPENDPIDGGATVAGGQ